MAQQKTHGVRARLAKLPAVVAVCVLVLSQTHLLTSIAYAANAENEIAAPLKLEKLLSRVGSGEDGIHVSGDLAEFDIVVTNTGDTDLTHVTLIEELEDAAFDEDFLAETEEDQSYTINDGGEAVIDVLPAGEEVVVFSSYLVSDKDGKAGKFVNVVSATADHAKKPVKSNELEVAVQKIADDPDDPSGPDDPDDPSGPDDPDDPVNPDDKPKPVNPDDPSTPIDTDKPYIVAFDAGWSTTTDTSAKALSDSTCRVREKDQLIYLGAMLTWRPYRVTGPSDANMTLTYSSSDTSIATVSSGGVVTPHGKNGIVTILVTGRTATQHTCSLSGGVTIVYSNQQEQAEINVYKKDGTLIPKRGTGSSLTFNDGGGTYAQELYATISYKGKVYSSREGTGKWDFRIENSEKAQCQYPDEGGGVTSVWADRYATDGQTNLIITITLDGELYQRRVPINVATGADPQGVVPDKLTISVTWANDPNPSNPKRTTYSYTMQELSEMATKYHRYTIVGDTENPTRLYAYQTGRGVELIKLLNSCEIYEDDILYLGFDATDPVSINSNQLGMGFFLSPCYYYPHFNENRNTSGAEIVPAMIAVSSRTYWNADAQTIATKVNTYADLGAVDGVAPRLLVGGNAAFVTGGRYSVRNIQTINVRLKGNPPANPWNEEKENVPKDDDDEEKPVPDDSRGNQGGGDSSSSGTTDREGNPAAGIGAGGESGADMGGNTGANAGGVDTNSTDTQNAGEASGATASDSGAKEMSYRIYQMMSTAQTSADISDDPNPLPTWMLWLLDIVVAAGAIRYLVWYRRERMRPHATTLA